MSSEALILVCFVGVFLLLGVAAAIIEFLGGVTRLMKEKRLARTLDGQLAEKAKPQPESKKEMRCNS